VETTQTATEIDTDPETTETIIGPGEDPVDEIDGPGSLDIVFNPPGGTFVDPIMVTLQSADGAAITYTTDGSVPVIGTHPVYTKPFSVSTSTTVRAIASLGQLIGPVDNRAYIQISSSLASFSSNIPQIIFHTFENAPTQIESERTPITVSVIEPSEDARAYLLGDASLSTRGGLRVRGSSTSGQPKHPYNLELWGGAQDDDDDMSVLGMAAESDWSLYAPLNFDRALMRNSLMYRLSNRLDRWASNGRFVELWVTDYGDAVNNSDYMGVYVLFERIKRGENRVDIEELSPNGLGGGISGGYIFKRDRLGSDEDGFTAGTGGGAWSFAQRLVWTEPFEWEVTKQQEGWLTSYIDDFGVALAAADHTHPQTGDHYTNWIDQDSWIDHHILNTLSMNPDAFRLSGYFFKDQQESIHAGPVWDFDRTMGCASDSRSANPYHWDPSWMTSDTTVFFEHGWYKGLFNDPVFAEAYWDRWRELIDGDLSIEVIHGMIDEMAQELDEAAPRNFERWSSYPPRGNGTHNAEVEILKDWVEDRHGWISMCLTLPNPEICN